MTFAKNCLSDGREIWALSGTYTQPMMFGLKGRLPAHESILSLGQFDDAMNRSGAAATLPSRGGWWRTCGYGVYPRGFEDELGRPPGATVVWVEDGYRYSFEVPDARNPQEPGKSLRESAGMLVFALSKLRYDRKKRTVSVSPDFDTATDVCAIDVMRPAGWALPGRDGYPLRSLPSDATVPEARSFRYVPSSGFEAGASGWHGSISLLYAKGMEHGRRMADATSGWLYPSGVAVAGPSWEQAQI